MTNEEKIIKIILKYQRDLDEYTLRQIATRLNSEKGLGLVDLFSVGYLTTILSNVGVIDKKALITRQRQVRKLNDLFTSSAISAYMSMQGLYNDGGKDFIPYKKNNEIVKYVAQEATNKCQEFNNAMRKVGYPITDSATNKKIFKTPSETYQYVAERAKSQELHNPFGYKLWSRKIVKDLLRSGLKIYNYSQDTHRYKHQNSYSYIRNFIKNTVYQISQGVFNIVANQVGINGVELSAHMDSALDHLPVQGHQFALSEFKKMQSNEDFEDIQGNKYHYLDRAIGTWNCRHFVYPIIIGKTKQRHTNEELDRIKNQSEKYKTIRLADGEQWVLSYADYQKYIRDLQDKIDKTTMNVKIAEKLGDSYLIDYYKIKLSEYKANLTAFLQYE